jgi:hypothetical protein
MSLSGMVESPRPFDPSAKLRTLRAYFRRSKFRDASKGETSAITLARFSLRLIRPLADAGRGEGPARITPSAHYPLTLPSPPRRRGGEGKILLGLDPRVVESRSIEGNN